jgi:adenylosuccinate synthase
MGVIAIVGGQFGSEGKGKIAGYLAREVDMAIRSGGPNAGHTVQLAGQIFTVQSIPCAVVEPSCTLAISAGAVFDPVILEAEISRYLTPAHTLIIDPMAGVIDPIHIEQAQRIRGGTGSPVKGVGPAHAHKALRLPDFRLARDLEGLSCYLADVALLANQKLDSGKTLMLEGTQGFGLSLHHGTYPHVASTDTTVGTLFASAGISPRWLDQLIMVVRTFPIRGGPGPLLEISWEEVTKAAGSPNPITEVSTVTKHVRRVGKFDLKRLKRAILVERPTQIALMFVDYVNHNDFGKRSLKDLSMASRTYIDELEESLNVPVTLISTGPDNDHTIDLRGEKHLSTYPLSGPQSN